MTDKTRSASERAAEIFATLTPERIEADRIKSIRDALTRACQAEIDRVLDGKGPSLLREAAYLATLSKLTDEQTADVVMFAAVNAWESSMIEARQAAIAAELRPDAVTWPAPPAGMADFLNGY